MSAEKEVLGFYLSDHPLKGLEGLTSIWSTGSIDGLSGKESKSNIQLVGLISSMREIITKKGTRMAFATFEDLTGTVELIVFPDAYKDYELVIKSEEALVISGTLENEEDSQKIFVDQVQTVDDVYKKAKRLVFHMAPEMNDKLGTLKELMEKHPGETPVLMELKLDDIGQNVTIDLKDPKGVMPSNEFFENVHSLFGNTQFIEFRTH